MDENEFDDFLDDVGDDLIMDGSQFEVTPDLSGNVNLDAPKERSWGTSEEESPLASSNRKRGAKKKKKKPSQRSSFSVGNDFSADESIFQSKSNNNYGQSKDSVSVSVSKSFISKTITPGNDKSGSFLNKSKPMSSNRFQEQNSLDAALNDLMEDQLPEEGGPITAPCPPQISLTIENEKEIRTPKTTYQIKNWATRESKYGHLKIQNYDPVETPPDELLEYNIVDKWDEVDPYSCVSCQLPFDTQVGRMPYELPCRHNSCLDCIKQSIQIDLVGFDCPIDNCTITQISEAKENKDLFNRGHKREDALTQQYYQNQQLREQLQREKEIEINAKKGWTDPQSLKKAEAQKIQEEREMMAMMDGSKPVAKGADKMLHMIKTEQDLEPEHSQASPLDKIDAQKQRLKGGTVSPIHTKVTDQQIPSSELKKMKPLDRPTNAQLFHDGATEEIKESQSKEVRRGHYPPGPVKDTSPKQRIYDNIKTQALDASNHTANFQQNQAFTTGGFNQPEAQNIYNRGGGLDDSQVRSLINRKYNPEEDQIAEQSGENTYNMSMNMTNKLQQRDQDYPRRSGVVQQDFEPPRSNQPGLQRQNSGTSDVSDNRSQVSYSIIGGKKKKKKKKKKKRAGDKSMISEDDYGSNTPVSKGSGSSPFPDNSDYQKNVNPVPTGLGRAGPPNLPQSRSTQNLNSKGPAYGQQRGSGLASTQAILPQHVGGEETFGLPTAADNQLDQPLTQNFSQEQIIAALKPYDTDGYGTLDPQIVKHALKQINMVITREVDEAIKTSFRENWGANDDDPQIDYMLLVRKIARDPPGQVRESSTRAQPKYIAQEPKNDKEAAQRRLDEILAQQQQPKPPQNIKSSANANSQFKTVNMQPASKVDSRQTPPLRGAQNQNSSPFYNQPANPSIREQPKSRQSQSQFRTEDLSSVPSQQASQPTYSSSPYQNPQQKPPSRAPVQSSNLANAGRQIMGSQSQSSYYDSQSYTASQPQTEHQPQFGQEPVPTYSANDEIQKRQVQKFAPKNFSQWGKLGQFCQSHPEEPVRYYCKDDQEPLCGECVVLHSKHDFIKADYKAASQIRLQLNGCLDTVETHMKLYQTVLQETNQKLKDMELDQKRQFHKVAEVFKEVREQLLNREKMIKKILHEKIVEAQSSLREDVDTVQKVLEELIKMKITGSELKKNFDDETDNVCGIVGSSPNVNALNKVIKLYQEDVLSGHEMGSFVVKKELSMHPAVPEFNYNSAECHVFIDELGQINTPHDFPSNPHGGAHGERFNMAGQHNQPKDESNLVKVGDSNIAQLKAQALVVSNAQLTQMYQQQMPAQDCVYWPKWDTHDVYQFDFFRKKWTIRNDARCEVRFLYFSSVCHLPKNLGMFILGGSDVDDNFSKRNTYFNRYMKFEDKAPMQLKRAFFPSVFCISDTSIYCFGGNSGDQDLASCERYSVAENLWRQISPMTLRRNGASCVAFEKHLFVFGGNEQDVGSLDSIEKYTIELDKWQLCRVYLKEPIHDTICFNLGGTRVIIFGGYNNTQPNTTFDVYDLTCETLPNTESLEQGKSYVPPVLDAVSGYLHYYVGYGDQELKHARMNIGTLMCSCQMRTGFKQIVPQHDNTDLNASQMSAMGGKSGAVSRSKQEMQNRRKERAGGDTSRYSQR